MGLKKYIIGSLLLAIAMCGYTFSIAPGDFKIQIAEFTLMLPIAVWVALPMLVLIILTVIHIMFYGLKNYFSLKAVTKDSQSVISLINKRLLNETATETFKNKNIQEIATIIGQLEINAIDSDFSVEDKDISKTVDQTFVIKSGKYIPSKELKLKENNPLMVDNTKNRITIDDNFALEVVKSPEKYSQEIVTFAFLKVVESKSMTSIKKVVTDLKFDNNMAKALFKKDCSENPEFAMTNDLILTILKKVELSNEELIEIIKDYKKSMSPDQLIKLFEDLIQEKEEYTTAYLYVLAEFEMIDEMRDILVNSATNEYVAFKALVDLKDAGKHIYSVDALSYK